MLEVPEAEMGPTLSPVDFRLGDYVLIFNRRFFMYVRWPKRLLPAVSSFYGFF